MKILRTATLGSHFTDSYKKIVQCYFLLGSFRNVNFAMFWEATNWNIKK